MPASADELKVARSWIGSTESDATFQERYDRLLVPGDAYATLTAAVEESLRAQLAALTYDQPAQLSTGGDSFNWSKNLDAMQKTLDKFLAQGGIHDPDDAAPAGVGLAHLYRRDPR
jgi:hypothetical protein